MEIFGRVISGGDTTPEGLLDVPKRFVYQIETETGSTFNLTYTSFPPSPVGDAQMRKVRLEFHEGRILTGQYVRARGRHDQATNTLTVSEEGDFIETSDDPY